MVHTFGPVLQDDSQKIPQHKNVNISKTHKYFSTKFSLFISQKTLYRRSILRHLHIALRNGATSKSIEIYQFHTLAVVSNSGNLQSLRVAVWQNTMEIIQAIKNYIDMEQQLTDGAATSSIAIHVKARPPR